MKTALPLPVVSCFAPLHHQLTPQLQEIQVGVSFQLPDFVIIGLPGAEITESKQRVALALKNSGWELPKGKILINLSPPSVRKHGTGIELGLALSLFLWKRAQNHCLEKTRQGAWGEIALDGSVRSGGKITRTLVAAWKGGVEHLFLARQDEEEARFVLSVLETFPTQATALPQVHFVSTLIEFKDWIEQGNSLLPKQNKNQALGQIKQSTTITTPPISPSDKLASTSLLTLPPALEALLLLAITGFLHCLVLGPKGVGKSEFLKWFPRLFPQPAWPVWIEQRCLEELQQDPFFPSRKDKNCSTKPFWIRQVGPLVRPQALLGKFQAHEFFPGEFSLAHGGCLIADEWLEWDQDSLEVFRHPLENQSTPLNRVAGSLTLPTQFLLAAASNLCPCGGWPPEWEFPFEWGIEFLSERCFCSFSKKKRFQAKLSQSLEDRIPLVFYWPMASRSQGFWNEGPRLFSVKASEVKIKMLEETIQQAQTNLQKKYHKLPGLLSATELEDILSSLSSWKQFLQTPSRTFSLRSQHHLGRIGLTLAALKKKTLPDSEDWQEALWYQQKNQFQPSFSRETSPLC